MAKIQEWEEQDVFIFFLPPYSPELNLIEILWRRIKYNWIPFDAYICLQNLKERERMRKIYPQMALSFDYGGLLKRINKKTGLQSPVN